MTSRTSGPSEIPSSASRSSLSSLVSFEIDRDDRPDRLRGAHEALQLGANVVSGRDDELERVLRGEAELVDRVQVAGVRDRDAENVALELVRDGHRTFERLYRDQLGRFDGDADGREVDDRKVMTHGKHAGDSVGGRDALVDQRLRERCSVDGPPTDERDGFGCDERRVLEEVEEELGRVVRAERRRQRTARGHRGACRLCGLLGTRCASDTHGRLPRRGYRQRESAA